MEPSTYQSTVLARVSSHNYYPVFWIICGGFALGFAQNYLLGLTSRNAVVWSMSANGANAVLQDVRLT
jgi:hypothetical protein